MESILRLKCETKQAAALVAEAKESGAALLFAYLVACGGSAVMPQPHQLGMTPEELERAAKLLVLYGVCADSAMPSHPRKEIDYHPAELREARTGDKAFSGLCEYYEAALGRMLRKSELEILFSVYDSLSMPAEVLMLLINYCAGRSRLTARELEKQAYQWDAAGVKTYAQAEKYLADLQRRHSAQAELMRLFGIYDRKLSESEQRLCDKWISYGYDKDLIALAYDRTVLRTGTLKWPYLDTILESWRTAGYKTRAQVEENEGKDRPASEVDTRGGRAAPPARKGEFDSGVVAAVTKQFEQKRLQREQLQETRLAALRGRSLPFADNERALRLCASKIARAAVAGQSDQIRLLRRENEQLVQQRADILRGLGVEEAFLFPRPQCEKCGDRGYIGTEMCECFRAACVEEQNRRRGR